MEILSKYVEIAKAATAMTTAFAVCKLLFGILNCFLGYKLLKLWVALCGFFTGFTVGIILLGQLTEKNQIIWWGALGIGAVCGLIAYEIYLVGVFVLGWLMTVSAGFSLRRIFPASDKEKIFLLVLGAVVGIIVGVLLVKFSRPGIILLTGISGGISGGVGFFQILHWENPLYMMAAGGCLALFGILTQWKISGR